MTAFFFDSQFRVVAAFADHAAGIMAFIKLYSFGDQMIFWSLLGYDDRVIMLNAAGQTKEIKITPEVHARMAAGIKTFCKK